MEILLPSLADSMTEGTIVRWLKHDGDRVEQGEELAEIETEKATVSIEADESGYLEVACQEGSTVAVGTVIGRIGAQATVAASAQPAAGPAPVPAGIDPATGNGAAARDSPVAEPAPLNDDAEPQLAAAAPAVASNGIRATPVARLLAEKHGLDVATVVGTGPRGRIRSSDVARSLQLPVSVTAPPAPPAGNGATVVEPTRVQRTIARRMTEAAAVPTFQVQAEATMDRALELRGQLRAEAGDGPVPSLNDFFLKASALALLEHPRVNGSYVEERFVLHESVNVGFAVAVEDALLVPTVRDADSLTLVALAAETRRLAEQVRAGAITPDELAGGTFTISNLGMFGMSAITPVLNGAQAAILGIGSIRESLTLSGGEVTVTQLTTLTLTCDHRILYGADGARFLARIRGLLEQPLRLLW